jgi:hypothetical protein
MEVAREKKEGDIIRRVNGDSATSEEESEIHVSTLSKKTKLVMSSELTRTMEDVYLLRGDIAEVASFI